MTSATARSNTSLRGAHTPPSLRGVSRGNLPLYSAFHVVLCPITEVDPHVASLLGMTFCLLKRRRCAAITRNPNTSRVYFYIPEKKKYCSLFFNVDCFYYLCIALIGEYALQILT